MPPSYIINEVGAKSVVISIILWKGAPDYKEDTNGVLHIITIQFKNYVKGLVAYGTNHVLG
jgi:hypothetical protein